MRFAISGFLRAVADVPAPPGWRIALKEQNKRKTQLWPPNEERLLEKPGKLRSI
jgi:hypothetical protein